VIDRRVKKKRKNLLIAIVVYLVLQLPVLFFEMRLFFQGLAERRRVGPLRAADPVVLRSARVSESKEGLTLSTTSLDLFGRVAVSWLMQIWIPGALVGAGLFIHLGLNHPGQPGTLALCVFLVWPFVSFAGLMLMFSPAIPPASVRREQDARQMVERLDAFLESADRIY
jgi:hypothetical protein